MHFFSCAYGLGATSRMLSRTLLLVLPPCRRCVGRGMLGMVSRPVCFGLLLEIAPLLALLLRLLAPLSAEINTGPSAASTTAAVGMT